MLGDGTLLQWGPVTGLGLGHWRPTMIGRPTNDNWATHPGVGISGYLLSWSAPSRLGTATGNRDRNQLNEIKKKPSVHTQFDGDEQNGRRNGPPGSQNLDPPFPSTACVQQNGMNLAASAPWQMRQPRPVHPSLPPAFWAQEGGGCAPRHSDGRGGVCEQELPSQRPQEGEPLAGL